jgi:hypothetical protein
MGLKAVGRVIRVSACILLAYDVLSFYIGQEKIDTPEVESEPEDSEEGNKRECMQFYS